MKRRREKFFHLLSYICFMECSIPSSLSPCRRKRVRQKTVVRERAPDIITIWLCAHHSTHQPPFKMGRAEEDVSCSYFDSLVSKPRTIYINEHPLAADSPHRFTHTLLGTTKMASRWVFPSCSGLHHPALPHAPLTGMQ